MHRRLSPLTAPRRPAIRPSMSSRQRIARLAAMFSKGTCALYRLIDAGNALRDQHNSSSAFPSLNLFTIDDGAVVAALFGFNTSQPAAVWTGLPERLDIQTNEGRGYFQSCR